MSRTPNAAATRTPSDTSAMTAATGRAVAAVAIRSRHDRSPRASSASTLGRRSLPGQNTARPRMPNAAGTNVTPTSSVTSTVSARPGPNDRRK